MPRTAEVSTLLALLGRSGENPIGLRVHRRCALTLHVLEAGATWSWETQPDDGDEMAAVMFVQGGVRVREGDGEAEHVTGETVFLHPFRRSSIFAARPATLMCVWVPWDALAELEDGTRVCTRIFPPTPIAVGLRAFAGALLAGAGSPTPYTDYLLEKLFAAMVFGALLEAGDRAVSATRESRAIDRARTLMVVRRGDPDFGIADVARELHMSTRQLQRVFSAEGSSPADELRRLRVELAQSLLADPDIAPLSVEDISVHAGFGTGAAMRRAFAALGLPAPRRGRAHAP